MKMKEEENCLSVSQSVQLILEPRFLWQKYLDPHLEI